MLQWDRSDTKNISYTLYGHHGIEDENKWNGSMKYWSYLEVEKLFPA